jgi:hypothetical protein
VWRGCFGEARASNGAEIAAYIVPADIEPTALAAAIDEKLRRTSGSTSGRSEGVLEAIGADADGQRVVAPKERLGNGDYDRGRRVLEGIITDIRVRRALMRAKG